MAGLNRHGVQFWGEFSGGDPTNGLGVPSPSGTIGACCRAALVAGPVTARLLNPCNARNVNVNSMPTVITSDYFTLIQNQTYDSTRAPRASQPLEKHGSLWRTMNASADASRFPI